jgi:peptidoglycan/xylan/chitin deacetylase (PgdA/CDA1 family)
VSGGRIVLLYHRVTDVIPDPHGLAVRPDRFAQHCEILRRRGEVVPLSARIGSTRQVAITFDDGYADNAGDARHILAAARLPATFFITVGRIGKETEVWWDRLEQIVLECDAAADSIEVEVEGRPLWIDIRSPSARERAYMALFWRLRPLRPDTIERILAEIASGLGVQPVDRPRYRWMTVEELRALASTDGVEIGAHTLTHPCLSMLGRDEQWREIDGSRRALQALLDSGPEVFSYPYGGADAVDAVTTQLVREAGYTNACTATRGIVRPDGDPMRIPRNVVGDWDADVFERWLDQWLTAP